MMSDCDRVNKELHNHYHCGCERNGHAVGCSCEKCMARHHHGCSNCMTKPPVCQPKDVTMFVRCDEPASLGDDIENPPVQGKYRNVLAVYEANGHAYLYDSGGIYTRLDSEHEDPSAADFNILSNRPSYAGVVMTGDTNIPDVSGVITDVEQLKSDLAAEKNSRIAEDKAINDSFVSIKATLDNGNTKEYEVLKRRS